MTIYDNILPLSFIWHIFYLILHALGIYDIFYLKNVLLEDKHTYALVGSALEQC